MKTFKSIIVMSFIWLLFGNMFVGASGYDPSERELEQVVSSPIEITKIRQVDPSTLSWFDQSILWSKQVDSIVNSYEMDRVKLGSLKNSALAYRGNCYITEITLKSKVSCLENTISFFSGSYVQSHSPDMSFHIRLSADKHDLLGNGYCEACGIRHCGTHHLSLDNPIDEKIDCLVKLNAADCESGEGRGTYNYRFEEMLDMVRQIRVNLMKSRAKHDAISAFLFKELKNVLSRIWLNFQIKIDKDRNAVNMTDDEYWEYIAQCSMCMSQRRLELFLLKELSEKICDESIFEYLTHDVGDYDYKHVFDYVIDYARLFCQKGFDV